MKKKQQQKPCKDNLRCYPHGECPLKDKCLWRGVPHKDETCADVEKFDNAKSKEKVSA